MSTSTTPPDSGTQDVGAVRLATGLVQGLAMLALHRASDAKLWPITEPALFWPLILIVVFVPILVLGGVGAMRRGTLVVWAITGAAVAAGLAAYDVLRQSPISPSFSPSLTFPAVLAVAAALFIAHHLIVAADQARRPIAPYPDYFDVAWKDGVQLALSLAFVGVFWVVLYLGAALFKVIGIGAFQEIIQKDWFALPATGLVFAGAVQLTDVRIALIRGVRTVGLALLSWLMPLMAVIAAAFLIALPFTGLKPLWKAGSSTGLLLSAAAALIVLINAAYQDGDPERRPASILRHAGRLAAVVLAPMVAIAVYGLWLRVGQHGWTPERIIASACALVAACYATGYLIAAVMPGPWLKPLEATNIATAGVVLAAILALFTPIADPARISVADQVHRLTSGATAPDKFDYNFLRFKAARYGVDALHTLAAMKTGPGAAAIAAQAKATLTLGSPLVPHPKTAKQLAADIAVYPKGRTLPAGLLDQPRLQLGAFDSPCSTTCEAYFVDFDGDGVDEAVFGSQYSLMAFAKKPDGTWTELGSLAPADCDVRDALRQGKFQFASPKWRDMELAGKRVHLTPNDDEKARNLNCK